MRESGKKCGNSGGYICKKREAGTGKARKEEQNNYSALEFGVTEDNLTYY